MTIVQGLEPDASVDVLASLAAWVVKDGVSLGGLAFELRDQLLALLWAGLPHTVMTEKQVNAALKGQLQAAARCMDTDHVELRRWLVDAGWLQRDGFGREYRRTAAQGLEGRRSSCAAALSAIDTASWVQQQRDQQATQREARRLQWQRQQAG